MPSKLSLKKFKRKKLLSKLHTGIASLWAPLVLITISLILSFLNYQPGTWLTGWDNLHPEFYFSMNLKRSLFAVWQEYQSLGLLGGMAHAADLPRQLLLLLLNSLGVPAQNLRYIWTFSMLTLGPLGVYFFIKHHLLKPPSSKSSRLFTFLKSKLLKEKKHHSQLSFDSSTKTFAALLGGLFYLLNLSTIQNFFVPFETFTSFYGFFPWLILVTVNYLHYPTRRHYLHLVLVYLLAAPSFYVETLFIVLLLCLLPLFKITNPKQTFLTLFTILITQAFWLLPVIFFVLTNGHVGEQAKINLIATPETYLRNLEFANLKSLSLLKGFLLNFIDLGSNQKFTYLLLPWREHLKNPLINLLGYLNFTLILTGIYYALKKKLKLSLGLLSITIICLFFLLGGGLLINNKIPLIGELFRSPFTKFSTPLSFTYSIFFSIGCIFLLDLFSFLHYQLTYIFTLFTITLSLLIFTSPAFSGQLISPNMKLKIPPEYFETFDFFKKQDPNTRIANFPQHTFWGWNFYSWGYRGSGFLWYGIKQPILDRAFDVWEKQSENYYQEINAALYSGNQKDFEEQIEKYAIDWILIDKFVIPPQKNQALKNQELIDLLDSSNQFKLEKNINNNILIYKTKNNNRVNNFISLTPLSNTQSFPFKNLSLRPNTLWKKEKDLLTYTTSTTTSTPTISFPSYTQTENLVPVEISYKKLPQKLLLKFSPLLPSINSLTPKSQPNYIYLDVPSFQSSLILEVGAEYFELLLPGELVSQPVFYPLTTTYLPTRDPINLRVYTNSPTKVINVTNALKDAQPYQCYTNKKDRKIEKITFSNSISLLGTDVVGCLSLPLPSFTPPGLISTQYTYFSPTLTPANSNITTQNLSFSTTPPQPLKPKALPFTVRQFSPLTLEKQQLNLILEANNTKSIQEITFSNITTNFHPLLASTTLTLNPIPAQKLPITKTNNLTLSLPLIKSSLNITQTPEQNQLVPKARNCNQFRSGTFKKDTIQDLQTSTIQYFAQNATTCDTLDLRHLPHSINYLIQIDHQHLKGLPMTICLENHSTNRCDVFERLSNTNLPQTLIQPISNPNEPPGYSLHLYNQSIGNHPTITNIKEISINPLPLNFLKNISITNLSSNTTTTKPTQPTSTHPTEFLYTLSTNNSSPSVLNLYQTRSPYWLAIKTNKRNTNLPLFKLILKTPYLYLKNPKLSPTNNQPWHNSWQLPKGEHHLILVYLPQYLEFLGLLLLPFSIIPIIKILFPRS